MGLNISDRFVMATGRVVTVSGLIAVVWIGFLWLIRDHLVAQVNALIMVWITGVFLLVAFFPAILRRIRSIEFKGLKFELDAARSAPPLRLDDQGSTIFTEKAGPHALILLLKRAAADRSRAILLEVNIGEGGRISLAALHLYLFLLRLGGNPVAVLFRSRKGPPSSASELRGVISADRLARIMRVEFPTVWRSVQQLLVESDIGALVNGALPLNGMGLLDSWHHVIALPDDPMLSTREFQERIAPELTRSWASVEGDVFPTRAVRKALADKADFLVLLESGTVVGLLDLGVLARRVAAQVNFDSSA